MPLKSENELAELTGMDRATIRKRLLDLTHKEVGRARMYESPIALARIYLGASENGNSRITNTEAARLLTIARRVQIELECQVTRGERPDLASIEEVNTRLLSNCAGLFKAHRGKVLDDQLLNDIFAELRGMGAALKTI